MGEVVNLNKARKARAKSGAKATAVENRAAHGRSRADRSLVETERARVDRLLDGSKLKE